MVHKYPNYSRFDCPPRISNASPLVRSILVPGASSSAPEPLQPKYLDPGPCAAKINLIARAIRQTHAHARDAGFSRDEGETGSMAAHGPTLERGQTDALSHAL